MLLKLGDNTLQYGAHIHCQAQTDSKAETISGPAHAGTLVTVLSLFHSGRIPLCFTKSSYLYLGSTQASLLYC